MYGLSCIEYTEFDKFGITDGPLSNRYFDILRALMNKILSTATFAISAHCCNCKYSVFSYLFPIIASNNLTESWTKTIGHTFVAAD